MIKARKKINWPELILCLVWMIAAVVFGNLSGCAALDQARLGMAEQGAATMDRAAQDATWTLCRAISVGAWLRAYGGDRDKAQAWRTLCAEQTMVATPAGQ
jgi:hypothetical protein